MQMNGKPFQLSEALRMPKYDEEYRTPLYPGNEFGAMVGVDFRKGAEARKNAFLTAIEHARSILDTGTVFEIRAKPIPHKTAEKSHWYVPLDKQNEDWGVAWYTNPEVMGRPTAVEEYNDTKLAENTEEGYCLLARIKA
jgi:hypothetical protein